MSDELLSGYSFRLIYFKLNTSVGKFRANRFIFAV